MTERTLVVVLEGRSMGAVTQDASGKLQFEYDDEWRLDPSSTPLSLSMPLAERVHANDMVEAFLWGLLPDNGNVLERWGREYQVSWRNPFALLSHVGEECAGAVQFVRPERIDEATRGGDVEWLDVDEIASGLRLLRHDPTAWHSVLHHGRFSLAGAQAKVALLREGKRWGRPSGRIPTTHIVKPAIEGLRDHDLNEHLCLRAAHLAGLRTARSDVVEFGGERAIVVERYDRASRGDQILRVHQEDLCQALGLPPGKKYQNEGGPTPLRIVTLLREVDSAASASVAAFVDALAFNWLIGGTDAHAKNYSLLLSGRQVRLAPLYDVASVLPYPEFEIRELKSAMRIGREYRLEWISGKHWRRLADELRLDQDAVIGRVAELAEQVPDCFARAGAEDQIRDIESSMPTKILETVGERASRCASLLKVS